MTSPAELQAKNFLRMGKCAVSERPMGEVYLLESEVLSVVKAQSDEVRRLREALLKYGHHAGLCQLHRHPCGEYLPGAAKPCTCGLNAALGSRP